MPLLGRSTPNITSNSCLRTESNGPVCTPRLQQTYLIQNLLLKILPRPNGRKISAVELAHQKHDNTAEHDISRADFQQV
jgi:hypothetical protein